MATTYDVFEMAPALPRMARTSKTGMLNGMVDFVQCHSVRVCEKLAMWHQRAYERRTLMHMDDRMLSDIGISPSERDCEGRKPCWVK